MDEFYTFTDADLWAYLSAKRDDEVIGYCGNVRACLIAQAVQAKYAAQLAGGYVAVTVDIELEPVGVCLPFSPLQDDVTYVFDCLTGAQRYGPVTKAEFMQAWQAFQALRGGTYVF